LRISRCQVVFLWLRIEVLSLTKQAHEIKHCGLCLSFSKTDEPQIQLYPTITQAKARTVVFYSTSSPAFLPFPPLSFHWVTTWNDLKKKYCHFIDKRTIWLRIQVLWNWSRQNMYRKSNTIACACPFPRYEPQIQLWWCLVMWLRVNHILTVASQVWRSNISLWKSDFYWWDPPILTVAPQVWRSNISLWFPLNSGAWLHCCTIQWTLRRTIHFFLTTSAVNLFHSHYSREYELLIFFCFLKKLV
jgi:hypothetical protein